MLEKVHVHIGSIYKITNLITGMSYIGQTKNNIKYRWSQHCKKDSQCTFLSRAIKKYGKSSFKIEEIYNAFDKEQLNNVEIELIQKHNTFSPNGYNLTLGGEGGNGLIRSDLMKPLYRICKKTKEIKEYESLSSVVKDGFLERSVRASCHNERDNFTYKGYYWVYKCDFDRFSEHVYKRTNLQIVQYCILSQKIIKHDTIQSLSDSGFSPKEIHSCCKERLCYKNSLWFYGKDFNNEILQLKINNLQNPFKVLNLKETVKGYSLHRKTNTYNVKIKYNGKSISLGYYKTELDARNAYLKELNKKSQAYLAGEL